MLPFTGLPVAGSAALALAVGCCGLAFTGIAAVAAQLTPSARAARGIALGVLGVAFVLRGVGDSAGPSGPSWLSWTSPLGWIELDPPVRRRDGGGCWPAARGAGRGRYRRWPSSWPPGAISAPGCCRTGPAGRPPRGLLRGPLGLAWRLQRGVLAGWAAGFAFTFAASGAAAKGIGQLLGSSTALQREFTRLGGQTAITNAYLAALMLLAGLGAAGYAMSAVLRLRAEETDGLAEPVLATATGRISWALCHVAVAVFGAAVAAGRGGPGGRPRLRPAGRVGRAAGGADDRRGDGPAARVAGDGGVAVALFGLLPGASRRRGVDRCWAWWS